MSEKHPISHGRADEHTVCWREHSPGQVCVLPEGHQAPALLPEPPEGTIIVDGDGEVAQILAGVVHMIRGNSYLSWWEYVTEEAPDQLRVAVPLTDSERTMLVNALLRDAWTHEYDDEVVHALADRIEVATA